MAPSSILHRRILHRPKDPHHAPVYSVARVVQAHFRVREDRRRHEVIPLIQMRVSRKGWALIAALALAIAVTGCAGRTVDQNAGRDPTQPPPEWESSISRGG